MFDMNTLLRFFDRSFVVKFFLILLFLSLFTLADGFALLLLAPIIGNFAILGLSASVGLVGFVVVVNGLHTRIIRIRLKIKEGIFPEKEFDSMAGLFLAGVMIIIPGFFTDAMGILLLFPVLQIRAGRLLTGYLETRLRQAYEYLKIEEY